MLKPSALLIVCCLLLAGCATRPPKLEPPEIRVVELTMSKPGQMSAQAYDLILRIRNTSEVELIVSSMDINLTLDGVSAGIHSISTVLDIPVLSTEITTSKGQIDRDQAQSLVSLQNGQRRQIPYTLEGELNSQGRVFKLVYEGWLSRSPGKGGSFR